MALRLLSLVLMLIAWSIGSQIAGPRMLPDPQSVALLVLSEAQSGALAFNLGTTLLRVVVAFTLAMALGSVMGLLMGRFRAADSIGDPWLVVLLNLPALVIIVLAYVWSTSCPSQPSPCAKARARSTAGSTRWRRSSA